MGRPSVARTTHGILDEVFYRGAVAHSGQETNWVHRGLTLAVGNTMGLRSAVEDVGARIHGFHSLRSLHPRLLMVNPSGSSWEEVIL